jgi:nitroreductase
MRAFSDRSVPQALVREILELAAFAPSNGNIQPWKVTVLTGKPLATALEKINAGLYTNGEIEQPEYRVYPEKLAEPYRSRRYACGELMYTAFGIPREDKPARIRQVLKNYIFFGAPVGLIITMSKEMDLGQAVDVGIFLQNLMLLATERGLASCPQASWAQWPQRVRDAMKIDSDQKIIVGLALGYADDGHAVNDLEQPRIAADDFVSFDGFD